VAGATGVGLPGAGLDVLEHGAGRGREVGQDRRGLVRRPSTAHRVQLRERPEGVRHAGQRPQPGVVLPDQGQVDQPPHGTLDSGPFGVEDVGEFGFGGLARRHEGIKDGELETREQVEGTVDRRSGGGARGELAAVGRCRSGEIGAFPEQPRKPVVRPAPELVGERTVSPAREGARGGRGAHRPHASGLPQRRVPARRPVNADEPSESAQVGVGVNQVELHYGAATDVGRVRQVNEDSYLADPPVFVVADGMGGHDGGDIASRIVVEEFGRLADVGYDPRRGPHVVTATLRACQRRLLEYGATHRGSDGRRWHGGTTAVVALLVEEDDGPRWLLANLGDSRIYRFSQGELVRVSTDHSVVQELVDAGMLTEEAAAVHPERHIITRALGGPDAVDPDFFVFPLAETERVLLCSDGVTGMIPDAEIARHLAEQADPRDAAERVVAAAIAAGGVDNATAVVVDVMGSVEDRTYDSRRQQESLHQKLGALP
jgi:protein phosphatase